MTTQPTQPAEQLSDRFVAVIRPKRRHPDRQPIESLGRASAFVPMLWRQIRALEARVIDDVTLLPQVVALAERLSEVANVAIAVNAERYQLDPHAGASMTECANVMGISKPSASERRARGIKIMSARIEAAGAVKFSEAKREREAIEAAEEYAAEQLGVVSLDQWRQRRAA